jgi:hypothetical protein
MDVLYTKGLSAAATILEEYGLSCESDMSLVDEDDLVVLCSKLKPFQSKLLRKWVQGLGAEQRAAAFMKDASAAKNHSTSPPLEDKGAEDEDEEENGDEDADADEDEDSDEEDKEVHGGAAGEQGAGDGKSDEDVRIIGQQSAQHHKEDGKRAKECVRENDAAAAKKAKTSTLSTEGVDPHPLGGAGVGRGEVAQVSHGACGWSLETCRGCAGPPGPDLAKRDLNPRIPARVMTISVRVRQ